MGAEFRFMINEGDEETDLKSIDGYGYALFEHTPMGFPMVFAVHCRQEDDGVGLHSMPSTEFDRARRAGAQITALFDNSNLIKDLAPGEEYYFPLTDSDGVEATVRVRRT